MYNTKVEFSKFNAINYRAVKTIERRGKYFVILRFGFYIMKDFCSLINNESNVTSLETPQLLT